MRLEAARTVLDLGTQAYDAEVILRRLEEIEAAQRGWNSVRLPSLRVILDRAEKLQRASRAGQVDAEIVRILHAGRVATRERALAWEAKESAPPTSEAGV